MYHRGVERSAPAVLSTFVRALIIPFRVLATHHSTIEAFVRRDIRSRYVTSVLGLSWALIQPVALLLLYTFVFAYILKIRFGPNGTTGSFALYLFCGMLPWLAFAEGITRSASVIVEQAPLIKKVLFPSEILPVYVVVSALVMELVGLVILLAGVGLFHRGLGWRLILLPVVLAFQFLFTMGIGWVLASLNVFLRDVGQILGLCLTLWMFLTPIFYPAELMPARYGWILSLNPMYYVVQAYRDLILEQRVPLGPQILVLGASATLSFVLGYWFFRRSKHAFVDVL